MEEPIEKSAPVLKIDNYEKAKEFHIDCLGFEIIVEWRHEPGLPVYMGINRDGLTLHLNEHKGDVQGYGGALNQIRNVHEYYEELKSEDFNLDGKPQSMPWDSTIFHVQDPFGNRLTFPTPNEFL